VSNATRWYSTREAVKAAVGLKGADYNSQIDSQIEAASEDVERLLASRGTPVSFIPITETHIYGPIPQNRPTRSDWAESENPWRYGGLTRNLQVDDLLAVTTIKIDEDQDGTFDESALATTEYELLPRNSEPKRTISMTDYGTTYAWPARSRVQIVGRWGYSDDTKAAGALAEALDTSETGVDVTDASLIDVGDTILVDSEQMFVSERSTLTTGTTLNDTLTADENDVTVTLASGSAVKQGELILLDSELMLVVAISGNNLTVKRGMDGSVLAAHSTGITVYAFRTLTVVRGVNGTTAASHDTAAPIVKYVPPSDIQEYVTATAIAHIKQMESGWTGQISGGEGGVEVRMVDLFYLKRSIVEKYGRVTL